VEINGSEKPVQQASDNSVSTGVWQRVAGVLWGGPKKTFEDIIALPNTLGIVVITLVLGLLLAIPILPKIKEYTVWIIQNSPGADKMPASAIGMASTAAVATTLIGSVLGPLLMWLIVAGLLKFFNSFSGETAPFKSLFTIAAYSYLPLLLASVIRTSLIMVTPAQNFVKVSTSLALLLPGDRIDRLYIILSKIDPFSIWSLVLLVIGSSLAMKTTYKNTAVYLGGLWLIYVLATGLLTPIDKLSGF
jgi:uncharacterized Tic20 family protein